MVGTKIALPHWAAVRTPMLIAASSAPCGVSANPDASPSRVLRGPAAEAGNCMPWKLAQVRPCAASASSEAGDGAGARRAVVLGRGAGVVRAGAGELVWLDMECSWARNPAA